VSNIERLKVLTGESDEELLSLLLEDAEAQVLSYTNRTVMIPALNKAACDLALIAYNRRGTEGECKRSEAGESYEFLDMPKSIYSILDQYRLARVGGVVYETKARPGQDIPSAESNYKNE